MIEWDFVQPWRLIPGPCANGIHGCGIHGCGTAGGAKQRTGFKKPGPVVGCMGVQPRQSQPIPRIAWLSPCLFESLIGSVLLVGVPRHGVQGFFPGSPTGPKGMWRTSSFSLEPGLGAVRIQQRDGPFSYPGLFLFKGLFGFEFALGPKVQREAGKAQHQATQGAGTP